MPTHFRIIALVSGLVAASLPDAMASARPCEAKGGPPKLTVTVTGTHGEHVRGAKVVLTSRKGGWTATDYTNEAGDVTFHPPKAGAYLINLTCDVPSCGDSRRLEHRVELHSGSSTFTLLTTEPVVIY